MCVPIFLPHCSEKDRHKSFASTRTKTMARRMATWKSKDLGKLSDKLIQEISRATGFEKKVGVWASIFDSL